MERILIEDLPPDERADIVRVESIDLSSVDLVESDYILWDAYPWLTKFGFALIIRSVGRQLVNGNGNVGGGLLIDAIIDDCLRCRAELQNTSKSLNYVKWASLSVDDKQLLKNMFEILQAHDEFLDEISDLQKCAKFIETL